MKRQIGKKAVHLHFTLQKELCSLCPIGDIAKLCDLREFRRSRPTEQTQPLIRDGKKNIVRLQNTEIKNIGEIIDVRILVMKKMPLVLIIPPSAPARLGIHRTIGRKQNNNDLRFLILCKNIIHW